VYIGVMFSLSALSIPLQSTMLWVQFVSSYFIIFKLELSLFLCRMLCCSTRRCWGLTRCWSRDTSGRRVSWWSWWKRL